MDPHHDVVTWVDSGEVGWGVSVEEVELFGQFQASVIGSSSTKRELRGLKGSLGHPEVLEKVEGKVVRLNVDSMCAVRNIIKGGGPVEALVEEVKELWLLCLRHHIRLHPACLSREQFMMKRVDVLSKVGMEWVLRQSFVEEVLAKTGLLPMAPDVAGCGTTIVTVVRRRVRTILVLPRWEAQSW